MTCQPNWVCTTVMSPGFMENAASSKGLTICPRPNQSRSPPLYLEGHLDLCMAICAKLAPALIWL